jgi:3-hydroxy acid dehydrogenase/malonic semialdehyde reductase
MIIFITGATSGFGRAMVSRFIKGGHLVVATGRRGERLQDLKNQFGENIHTVVLDVRRENEVKSAIENLPLNFRNINVLVNNAGLAVGVDPAQRAKREDWQTMVETNINGLLNVTHALLPGMVARNEGHIVNLGSVAGEFPYPGGNVYGATKAFVHQLSLNLKADLVGTAVRVSCVEPGMCETEFSIERFGGDHKRADAVYAGMTPLSADDIAETIEWIVTRPAHLNVNVISLMPTDQAFAGFAVHRK